MDEDDIAFLRLTALKSLNAKKEADLLIQTSQAVAATKRLSRSRSPSPQIVYNHLASTARGACKRHHPPSNDYSPPHHHHHHNQQRDGLHHGGIYRPDAYSTSSSSQHLPPKMESPYVASHWNSPPVQQPLLHHLYHSPTTYVPTKIHPPAGGHNNVQLSPRSAAFVFQNNDILARRIGASPSPPAPSHSYRAQSPLGRWSESPPPPLLGHGYAPHTTGDFRRDPSPRRMHHSRSPPDSHLTNNNHHANGPHQQRRVGSSR